MNGPFLFGSTALLIACLIIFIVLTITLIGFWIYIACLVDLFRKSEDEFKDRNLWLIILIGSFVIGMPILTGLIYFFIYRPKLNFL